MKAAAKTTAKRKTRKKKRPPLPEPETLSPKDLMKALDLLASGATTREMLEAVKATWTQFNKAMLDTQGGYDRYRDALEQRKRYWEVEADERMHDEAMRTDKEVVTTKGDVVTIGEANTKALTYWHAHLHPASSGSEDADTAAAVRSAFDLVRLGNGGAH